LDQYFHLALSAQPTGKVTQNTLTMDSSFANSIKKLVSENRTSDALSLLIEASKPNKPVRLARSSRSRTPDPKPSAALASFGQVPTHDAIFTF